MSPYRSFIKTVLFKDVIRRFNWMIERITGSLHTPFIQVSSWSWKYKSVNVIFHCVNFWVLIGCSIDKLHLNY